MIVGGKILSFWTPGKEYWAQLPENFISLEKVFLFNYSGYKHSSLSLYFYLHHVNTCTENRTIRLSIGVFYINQSLQVLKQSSFSQN